MGSKKFFIQTFGCQMNVYDSGRIAQVLTAQNYHPVLDPAGADLILINTCSVREKPEKKVYSALGRFRALKRRKPGLLIGVTGCVAQQEGEGLLARVPYLDFVLGTKELKKIPEILEHLENTADRACAVALNGRIDPYRGLPLLPDPGGPTAFVSIMQGCDNFCSFCVVPLVRGREVSRPSQDIREEIRALAEKGVKEVTLLGQNVNSYGQGSPGEPDFAGLLESIEKIPGIERTRFTTSHPKDLSTRLIGAFGRLSRLCEHIHLPLQSGSNRILERMNRGYTKEEYLEKVERLRSACPGISITTDIIVGFPGETEEDFRQTLEMLERIRFEEMFSFRYSDRPRTRASAFPAKIPEEMKQKRLVELQALQRGITQRRYKTWEGREAEILVEGPSRAGGGEKTGRTRANHIVNFPGASVPVGSLVRVRVQKALAHSLKGELLTD